MLRSHPTGVCFTRFQQLRSDTSALNGRIDSKLRKVSSRPEIVRHNRLNEFWGGQQSYASKPVVQHGEPTTSDRNLFGSFFSRLSENGILMWLRWSRGKSFVQQIRDFLNGITGRKASNCHTGLYFVAD